MKRKSASPGRSRAASSNSREREGSRAIAFCGKIEAELAGLDEAEARTFRAELGIDRSGLDQLILRGYDLLGLMTFLTAGEKETRAWTIERNTKAPQAAGQDPFRHRARLHPRRNRLVR